ncbi:hypothetical protein AAH994_00315 [Weeksellaceae bacterium A-14]
MKNITLLLLLLTTASYHSQITMFSDSPNMNTVLFKNKVYDMENKEKNIAGTAYIYQDYVVATIDGIDGTIPVRYNAYKDDIEVKGEDGNAYVIPREEKFSSIKIIPTNEMVVLKKYTDNGQPYEGYLFLITTKNNFSFYKKEKTEFHDFQKARNSYAEDQPARFTALKPRFFIQIKDGEITEFPKNKKKLIEFLPEKKDAIEAYLKKNKVDFSSEKDLKNLINAIG